MKTEQTLMCVLLVICALMVVGAVAAMLGTDVPPVQMAHSAIRELPLATLFPH